MGIAVEWVTKLWILKRALSKWGLDSEGLTVMKVKKNFNYNKTLRIFHVLALTKTEVSISSWELFPIVFKSKYIFSTVHSWEQSACIFIAFKESLINYLENKVNVNDFDFDKIYKYNLNLFIVSLIAAFIGLLTFITGVIYCKKLKKSKYYKRKGKEEEEDILKGLDYPIPIESEITKD